MELGLVMVVRNEADRIYRCLRDIATEFSHVTVVDTGSTDATISILQDELKIRPILFRPPPENHFDLVRARNIGLSSTPTEWVFTLDADELVSPDTIRRLRSYEAPSDVSGLFMRWIDHRWDEPFEDYKLFAFRNREELRFYGRAHPVPQTAIRLAGGHAEWFEGEVSHFPDPRKHEHRTAYRQQLRQGIEEHPDWYRYHWFLGYSLLKDGDPIEGYRLLEEACRASSKLFPVETLNSFMVKAVIESEQGQFSRAYQTVLAARAYLLRVAYDFEVRINFRLHEWLDSALASLTRQVPVKNYEFAY